MRMASAGYGALAVLAVVLAYDPGQSTGTGTHQEAEGQMSTGDRAPVDSKSGRNEESGSATGAVRPRSESGREAGASHGSKRSDTDAGRSMGQSGAGTTSGAAKPSH